MRPAHFRSRWIPGAAPGPFCMLCHLLQTVGKDDAIDPIARQASFLHMVRSGGLDTLLATWQPPTKGD